MIPREARQQAEEPAIGAPDSPDRRDGRVHARRLAGEARARNDAYSPAQALVEAMERGGCAPKSLKLDIDLQHGRPCRAEDQGLVERWWRTWRELLAHETRPISRMALP